VKLLGYGSLVGILSLVCNRHNLYKHHFKVIF
jgi:hypothetical protein